LGSLDWPTGPVVDDVTFHDFVGGKDLIANESSVDIRPWKKATELMTSRLTGSMIKLPTICGRHVVYYPSALVTEAASGRYYAFMTSCECETAYLIHTEYDGAHCKLAESAERVQEIYEAMAGEEFEFRDEHGGLICMMLPG
jgi:hypothetical protein